VSVTNDPLRQSRTGLCPSREPVYTRRSPYLVSLHEYIVQLKLADATLLTLQWNPKLQRWTTRRRGTKLQLGIETG
jgi:hypothetical protein